MVKNYFLQLFVVLLCAGLAAACSNDETGGGEETLTLKVSPREFTGIPAAGTEYAASVKSNSGWSVSGIPDWIRLSADKGVGDERITLTVLANTSDSREAVITFSTNTEEVTVSLSQLALKVPDPAGNIIGEDSSELPIELRIREIEGAETYRWYCDGEALVNSEARVITATKSGVYRVAGVNAAGEGPMSPEKSVYITPESELFINKLEGTWKSTGIYVDISNQYGNHMHTMEIVKKNSTTIEIIDFAGFRDQGAASVVTAEVDNTQRTITIKHPQEQVPTWLEDYRTFISPLIINTPKILNFGLSFPPIKVEEDENGVMTVNLYAGGEYTEIYGSLYYGSYVILFTNMNGTAATTEFMYMLSVEWEKL